MGALADRAGTRAVGPSPHRPRQGGASLPPAHSGAAGCASGQCRAPGRPRTAGPRGGVPGGRLGRRARPGSWGPGAQCCAARSGHAGDRFQVGALGRPTRGIVCPSLLSPPRAEAAPGVGRCGPAPTPPAFWSQTPAERKRVMGEGKATSLWESACMSVNCGARRLPSRVGTLVWAHMRLLGGLLLPLAWRIVQSSHPACVRLARPGLRLAGDFPSWFRGGPTPWQETANIVH